MCGESPQGMFSTFSLLPAREQFLSGCGPHFSFVPPKRKRAGYGTKEKALGDELTHLCQLTHTKERPVRTADKNQKSSAGCAESTQMT